MQNLFFGFGRLCRTRILRAIGAGAAGIVALAVSGCDLINPDEQVPAYLRITPFAYAPTTPGSPPTPGAVASAFVYADNQLLGVFDLPAKVPVLREGTATVRVVPAISPDGQRATRVTYPFYTDLRTTYALQAGGTITINPTTAFNAAETNFISAVADNFEPTEARAFREPIAVPGTNYVQEIASDAPLTGNFGQVRTNGKTDVFYLESNWEGTLPNRGAAIYLELDYRSTMPFRVGVKYNNIYRNDLTVFPNQQWTKLYVNLTDEVSFAPGTPVFRIFLQGLPTGAGDDFLAFDNVRLVTPK